MNIITISREFGSGGREVGKRLADALGYGYYDREILTAMAQSTEMEESYLMSTEQTPVFFAAPKYPAMLSKLAKGRTESYGDSARGPTWQSHEQRFPAALQ